MGRGRRIQIAAVLALLWIAFSNVVLQAAPAAVFWIGILLALAAWFVTGAIADRTPISPAEPPAGTRSPRP